MKIIDQSVEILSTISPGGIEELKRIELAGRTAYKSEDKIYGDGAESAKKFITMLIHSGHESVLEHSSLTVKFITDRGISHEIVRHRIASFTQESTRYCNYSKDKFNNEITVIDPHLPGVAEDYWKASCENAETTYFNLLNNGITPEYARCVLPTCLKTEIIMTANYREWRHFLALRSDKAAHPQIRHLSKLLLKQLVNKIPIVFNQYLLR